MRQDVRQKTEDGRQETEDRRWEAGDRRQETGGGRRETGDRRQETGDRRQETGEGSMMYTVQYSVAEVEPDLNTGFGSTLEKTKVILNDIPVVPSIID